MKVIIAGGRDFVPGVEHTLWLQSRLAKLEATEVVSGAARGADRFGEITAQLEGIPVKQFPADWATFGKRAGYLRNKEMAEYADALLALPGGKGTEMMIRLAKQYGLHVEVFDAP